MPTIRLLFLYPILFIFFFCLPFKTAAADTVSFERLGVDQGLSQSNILAIHQGPNGFMWFGTQDGLNRFDGYDFKIFRHNQEDQHSIIDSRIRCIYRDRMDNLWIGTEGGLSKYNSQKENFISFQFDENNPESLGHNTVRAVFEDSKGTLWVGTRGGGLNRLDRQKNTFTRYLHNPSDPNSISNNQISSITEDNNGNLWVGTFKGGLNKLGPDRSGFVRYVHSIDDTASIGHDKIIAVYTDSSGTVWAGTYGGGLNRYSPEKDRFDRYLHDPEDRSSISSNRIRSIYEDSKGRLLVGTNAGLSIFSKKTNTFSRFRHDPTDVLSISDDTVPAISEDGSGVVWVGTLDGISQLIPKKEFTSYTHHYDSEISLSSSNVSALFQDKNGSLYTGTRDGGLTHINKDQNRTTIYTHKEDDPKSLSSNDVRAILRDSAGNLWVGTYIGGVNKYNSLSKSFTSYRTDETNPSSISGNDICGIVEAGDGKLWIGTNLSGLNLFNPVTDQFTHYKHSKADPTSISSNRVWSIFVDSKKTLWAGTYGAGLNRFDAGSQTFTRYVSNTGDSRSLSNNVVLTVFEDRDKMLWIGTQGGLNKFNPQSETFTRYTKENGLANNVINAIEQDESGNLWLSTNKGISKFNPVTEIFNNYEKGDGLESNEFNPGASTVGNDGRLLFGGTDGLIHFIPAEIKDNSFVPPVMFTSFSRNGIQFLPGADKTVSGEIVLDWKQNSLEFAFSALNFVLPDQNQYAYMMENLDNDWYYSGTQRQGRYSSIPPGTYTLKVKGSNNDGIWNNDGAAVRVVVKYPPWETPIAYGLYSLLSFVLLGGYLVSHQRKERKKKEEKKLLEQLVSTRTRELQKLTQLQQEEIAHRQKTERALRSSELKLKATIDASPFPIAVVDVEDENISYWSKSAITLFGHTASTVTEWYELAYPDPQYRQKMVERWKSYLGPAKITKTPVKTGDYSITCKDGSVRLCELYATFLEDSLIVSFHDITEQKQAEREKRKLESQLYQSRKMESIGTLAGGIAHEFNNILTIILGSNELVMDEIPSWSHARESANDIRNASLRARDIVKQLLTFSRQDDAKRVPLNMVSVVKESMKLIRSSTSTNVTINTKIAKDVSPIKGNATQINQIIINLCNNAVDALKGGNGILDVEMSNIELEDELHFQNVDIPVGRYVRLRIKDNGSGITDENCQRIFEPYFTTKNIGEGTGIGLAIVHGIIQRHNGYITVDSVYGEETTFAIYFPVYEGLVVEESEAQVSSSTGTENVLMVDDESQILTLNRRSLENVGYQVRTAQDPLEAMKIFKENPDYFDLIITDMAMPNMRGDQLIREIHAIRRDVPAIICTGNRDKLSREDTVEIGIDEIAIKPIEKQQFVNMVRRVLDTATVK